VILLVQDIIKDALGLVGAIAIDETPTASEYTQAIRTANVMIDRWASQRLLLRSTSTLTIPLVVNKLSYTIGPVGADITSAKPISLYSGYVRDAGNNDRLVDVIDLNNYNNLEDKASSSGNVDYVAYDPGETQQAVGKGTVYVYHPPSTADTLYLEVDNYLTEFVNLGDTVTFEPAYYEALVYNLAVRLFRYYRDANIQVPQDIMMIAQNSINNLKAMNSVTMIAACDLPGKSARYNIMTDTGN